MGLKEGGARGSLRNISTDVNAIPDSGLLHQYDATKNSSITENGSVTQWNDLEGNEDLTGTVSGGLGSINGVQAILFDGVDDSMDVDFSSAITQPFEIFTVSDPTDDGTQQNVFDGFANTVISRRLFDSNDTYRHNAGANIDGGSPTGGPEILSSVFNGTSSLLRGDGTEILSGDAGANSLDGLTVGSRRSNAGNGIWFNGPIGEVLIYDPSASGYSRSDVEGYLSQKWGISLA
jgi:hypothetical protein